MIVDVHCAGDNAEDRLAQVPHGPNLAVVFRDEYLLTQRVVRWYPWEKELRQYVSLPHYPTLVLVAVVQIKLNTRVVFVHGASGMAIKDAPR
jgi:hypothetical protein